ncbi:MAG: translation initiation factor [Bacteroidota bacterium]|jgi:translation initiation factor 1
MSKKNKSGSAFVYSTDPHFQMNEEGEEVVTLSPSEQRLRVILETKHRAGKTVTVVLGYIGKEMDLEELGKKLKNHCGTGGSAKDGEIILQGDQREKATQWLRKNNFGVK